MIFQLYLLLGTSPRKIFRRLQRLPMYCRNRKKFLRQNNTDFPEGRKYPCLTDADENSGTGRGAYFYQDLWVAQDIFKANPQKHVDIGSRIDGFVAHVAIFRSLEVMDIRPLNSDIPNVSFVQADLMQANEKIYDYCDSISCLHALEHFGLGRYGDPIDANGHIKGLQNINNILKKGGTFYFSVPMGPQRVEFNAHRVFSLTWLTDYFKDKYRVRSFSYIDDRGEGFRDVGLTSELIAANCGCWYGCAVFVLEKV